MNWSDLNLMPAMPEIVLLALLGVVLLVDLWICDKKPLSDPSDEFGNGHCRGRHPIGSMGAGQSAYI